MKLAIVFLLFVLVLISGCASKESAPESAQPVPDSGIVDTAVENINDVAVEDKPVVAPKEVKSSRLIVDKNKYITGGSDFDNARQYFLQEPKKGYKFSLEANKQVEVILMTESDCVAMDKSGEFSPLYSIKGTSASFEEYSTYEQKRNMCIYMKALENGEIINHIVIDELSF